MACLELGVKIIYIDDDATNRELLRDMLALEGIGMVEAADARTGIEIIGKETFDLIFMDLRMPDINGVTAIRQLRAGANQCTDTPIVVVTADPSEGVRTMCRAAGANGFLDKPIDMAKLSEIVETAKKGWPTDRSALAS